MAIIKEVFKRNDNNEIIPLSKLILTKINDEYILYQKYNYKRKEWIYARSTSYFNGEKVINGTVHHLNGKYNVDEYFNLLVQYEGWKIIEE